MSVPDFRQAEYSTPQVIEGDVVGRPVRSSGGPFAVSLLFGAVAAIIGSIGYALVGLSGFMISIVAIGVAWLIAKAMMTASGGIGGRPYQIGAVILTYFAVSVGEVLHPVWQLHREGLPLSRLMNPALLRYVALGPFLNLGNGINGILGLIILGIGLRAAWRMAAGGPGFGQGAGGPRVRPFGLG